MNGKSSHENITRATLRVTFTLSETLYSPLILWITVPDSGRIKSLRVYNEKSQTKNTSISWMSWKNISSLMTLLFHNIHLFQFYVDRCVIVFKIFFNVLKRWLKKYFFNRYFSRLSRYFWDVKKFSMKFGPLHVTKMDETRIHCPRTISNDVRSREHPVYTRSVSTASAPYNRYKYVDPWYIPLRIAGSTVCGRSHEANCKFCG